MTGLQAEQVPIDRAIFAEVLECLPAGWTSARLQASSDGNPDPTLTIRIDGAGQPGLAIVSDALQDRVRELFLLNSRYKTGLRGIDYTYRRREDGRWALSSNYEYE